MNIQNIYKGVYKGIVGSVFLLMLFHVQIGIDTNNRMAVTSTQKVEAGFFSDLGDAIRDAFGGGSRGSGGGGVAGYTNGSGSAPRDITGLSSGAARDIADGLNRGTMGGGLAPGDRAITTTNWNDGTYGVSIVRDSDPSRDGGRSPRTVSASTNVVPYSISFTKKGSQTIVDANALLPGETYVPQAIIGNNGCLPTNYPGGNVDSSTISTTPPPSPTCTNDGITYQEGDIVQSLVNADGTQSIAEYVCRSGQWEKKDIDFTLPVSNVACPADVQQCPDGSYVSRRGPNCEFAQCPNSAGTSGGRVCPTDVIQCPDGSSVRRTGPNCELQQCPNSTETSGGYRVNCPADVQQCPDGSYVSRRGPQCEFAQCPSSEQTSSGASDDSSGCTGFLCSLKKAVTNSFVYNLQGGQIITGLKGALGIDQGAALEGSIGFLSKGGGGSDGGYKSGSDGGYKSGSDGGKKGVIGTTKDGGSKGSIGSKSKRSGRYAVSRGSYYTKSGTYSSATNLAREMNAGISRIRVAPGYTASVRQNLNGESYVTVTRDSGYEGGGGGGVPPVRSCRQADSVFLNDAPFGENGSFPVRLRIDFDSDGTYDYVEYKNAIGPLAGGDTATLFFPEFTVPAGDHNIELIVDLQDSEDAGNGCGGDWGCIQESGVPQSNTLIETFSATDPEIRLGTHLNRFRWNGNWAHDPQYGTRFINTDPDYDPTRRRGGQQVGLFWKGVKVDYTSCTGSTFTSDGTVPNDFSGQKHGQSPYTMRITGTRYFDLYINEPAYGEYHQYDIECDTDAGGKVSDSVIVCNNCDIASSTEVVALMPSLSDLTVRTGETVENIPFTVTNRGGTEVSGYTYSFAINGLVQNSRAFGGAHGAGSDRVMRANVAWTAPSSERVVPMRVCISHPDMNTTQCDNAVITVISATECSDGIDNDGDGDVDMSDASCTDPDDDSESEPIITANPTLVRKGDDVEVTWDPAGFTGCTLSSQLSGDGAVAGSETISANAEMTLSITCDDGEEAEVTVKVLPVIYES